MTFFHEINIEFAYEILDYLKKHNKNRNDLNDINVYNVFKNDPKCPVNLDEIINMIMLYQLESNEVYCLNKYYKTVQGVFPVKNFGKTATVSGNHLVYEKDIFELFNKLHGSKHIKTKTAMKVFRKNFNFYFPGFTSAYTSFVKNCTVCKKNSMERKNLKRKSSSSSDNDHDDIKDQFNQMKLEIDKLSLQLNNKTYNNNNTTTTTTTTTNNQTTIALPPPFNNNDNNDNNDDDDENEVLETSPHKKQKTITIQINLND